MRNLFFLVLPTGHLGRAPPEEPKLSGPNILKEKLCLR